MKQKFFDILKEQVMNHFTDYLISRGLKVKGRSFQCPNHSVHKHDDNNPSCELFADGLGGKCFRCGKYWDIFEAYKFLEGEKPFLEILKDLGKEFAGYTDDDYLDAEEEEKKSPKTSLNKISVIYFTLRKILGLLHEVGENPGYEMKKRGWEDSKINTLYDVLELSNDTNFREYVFGRITDEEKDIIREYFGDNLFDTIFANTNMVFAIRDFNGKPVAFSARRQDVKPKYIHNHNFDGIFKKSFCLYGYPQINEYDKTKPLFIVEGYADVVSLAYVGVPAVAIMGTSMSKDQQNLIINSDFKNVVIMLDNDDAGYKGMTELVDMIYPLIADRSKNLFIFPWHKLKGNAKDPDELVRKFLLNKTKKRIESFVKTGLSYNVYNFYIDKYKSLDNDDFYNNIINFITKTDILIEHIRWSRELSKIMDVSSKLILDEIHRRQSLKLAHRDERMSAVAQKLSSKLYKFKHNGGDIYNAIVDAYNQSSDIIDEYLSDITSKSNSSIEVFDNFLSFIKSNNEENYIKIDWENFARLQFYGIAQEPVFTMVSGNTHAGKSSILRNITYQILKNAGDKKIVVLFHSNDDDKARVFQAFLSIISGVPIFNIRSYNRLMRSKSSFAMEAKERLITAENFMRDVLGGHLIVTDVNDGNSIRFLSREIEKVLNIGYYPILFIDSLHKLEETSSGALSEVERIGNIAINVKRKLALYYHIPVFVTSEKRKSAVSRKNEFTTNDDLAGSRKLGYEPDIIILLQNEHARLNSDDPNYVVEEDDPFILKSGIKKFLGTNRIFNPYIEARVTKNKFSGYSRHMYYILKSATTRMIELTKEEEREIGLTGDTNEKKTLEEEIPKEWS